MMMNTILFDFDGVIIDSEPIHTHTKGLALDFFGIRFPEDIFDQFKGTSEEQFFVYVSQNLDSQHRPVEQFIRKRQEILSAFLPGMPVIEGFSDFIGYLGTRGINTALVTSSTQAELDNIDRYLNLTPLFGKVISADATEKHKPDPEPYLKAMEVLDVSAGNAIVIEDSENGIISGKRAGCRVFALTTTFTKEELLRAGADMVFEHYSQMKQFISGM